MAWRLVWAGRWRAARLERKRLLAAAALDDFAPEKAVGYYPPALMGMRGNHDGTFTFAHRLRDGGSWDSDGAAVSTGETYDLVVVGGGISGLAAAYFYRKSAGASARILILDNHDDFGGHAKRNEFRAGDRMVLSYGGTQSIESPGNYSDGRERVDSRRLGLRRSDFTRITTRSFTRRWGRRRFLIRRHLARTG